MAKLPVDIRLKTEVKIEDRMIKQERRTYLGISGIADKCPRKLWYGFRWCSEVKISARIQRLLERGQREEEIIRTDFRYIGIKCHSDQMEVVDGNGHIKGHIDDILEGVPDAPKTPHLGEYKTHNDKSFKALLSDGLIKSKPIHYGQMICYMYKLDLKRGLYVGVNKNDDSRYYERIESNNSQAKELLQRGLDIISTEKPPSKIGNPTWWECKFCNHLEVCHYGKLPSKSCRNCQFGDIYDNGKWECSKYKVRLTRLAQEESIHCPKHLLLETLR